MIKPEDLKNIKISFSAALDLLKNEIKEMQSKFNILENETNNLIRSYDAIKLKCDTIISDNDIELFKPIEEYSETELESVYSKLKSDKKSELNSALNKLKKRENEINNHQNEISDLINLLSHYSISEKDSKQELIITQEKEEENDSSLESILDIQEEDFLSNLHDYDKEIIPDNIENEVMTYVVEDGISLVDIATNVYQNAAYWSNLYEYGNNKEIIDEKINNLDIEGFIYDKEILSGLSLEIPKTLTVYEQKTI